VALLRSTSPLRRRERDAGHEERAEVRRLQERQENMHRATEEWLSLLREMEQNGESASTQYERYYQAYLQAKQQQKMVDLELFNRRHGLIG
jgi:nucleosome binding factor SPN SPT16 subunit